MNPLSKILSLRIKYSYYKYFYYKCFYHKYFLQFLYIPLPVSNRNLQQIHSLL